MPEPNESPLSGNGDHAQLLAEHDTLLANHKAMLADHDARFKSQQILMAEMTAKVNFLLNREMKREGGPEAQ